MIEIDRIKRFNFLSKPTLIQASILIYLYGTLAFFLLDHLNPASKQGFYTLIEYSGFMVGVSTIIASIAAVSGVNNWVKHIKHAEYFKLIWEAKKSTGMYYRSYLIWSQDRGLRYDKSNEIAVIRSRKYEEALEKSKEDLCSVFSHLDAFFFKGKFNWSDESRDFVSVINQYKALLLKGTCDGNAKEKSEMLIDEIQQQYEKINIQLELLEQSFSR